MRVIDLKIVTKSVKEAVMKINYELDHSLVSLLKKAKENETDDISKSILSDIIQNQDIARKGEVPLCQDTGVVVVFLEIGLEVSFSDDIYMAINEGVRQGYKEGFLRKSIVNHPFNRVNTLDNTPAIIHTKLVDGDKIKLKIASKGGGSENMSRSKMLKPSDGIKGVEEFVVETVSLAGPNPCPPIVVGVGIGGTIEKAAQIAKKALTRDLNSSNEKEHIAELEKTLLKRINKLGIGPQGLGGSTTSLGVNIEVYPTHIAGLPVVVNINCHASRHIECEI